jgi:AraC-like DNA-binding protein
VKAPPDRRPIAPVVTVLEPAERDHVDRAGAGLYRTVHRESISDVLSDLRTKRIGAVLLSASRCRDGELPRTRRVIRDFPGVPAVVLLSGNRNISPGHLLALGNCGMEQLVDVREPGGWTALRDVIAQAAVRERDELAIQELLNEVEGAPDDLVRFLRALFGGFSVPRTVRDLARNLGVLPSTLVSRFYRAQLPAPKRYLALAGLVRAARLLENPGLSIADVAAHLDHSSPQSFARHVRIYLGMSAAEFRRTMDGEATMRRFRDELITPHVQSLKRLAPTLLRAQVKPGPAAH